MEKIRGLVHKSTRDTGEATLLDNEAGITETDDSNVLVTDSDELQDMSSMDDNNRVQASSSYVSGTTQSSSSSNDLGNNCDSNESCSNEDECNKNAGDSRTQPVASVDSGSNSTPANPPFNATILQLDGVGDNDQSEGGLASTDALSSSDQQQQQQEQRGDFDTNSGSPDRGLCPDDDFECTVMEDGSINGMNLLSCFLKYWRSPNVTEKHTAMRQVSKALQVNSNDPSAVEDIFNAINECRKLTQENEVLIQIEMLEQLPMLIVYCYQSSYSSTLLPYLHSHLFPALVQFLSNPNHQIRKTCQAAILILLEQDVLPKGALEERICPVLLTLGAKSSEDDVRVEAVQISTSGAWVKQHCSVPCQQSLRRPATSLVTSINNLLCKLIPSLSRQSVESLILPRFTELCTDTVFHIRKICASNFGILSRVLGCELTERILVPHLINLSQDHVWGVRKACAECFTEVSQQCSMRKRRTKLAPIFIIFLVDNSRWVQSAAFQQLGPFIATFADATRTGLELDDEGHLSYHDPSPGDDDQNNNNSLDEDTIINHLNRSGGSDEDESPVNYADAKYQMHSPPQAGATATTDNDSAVSPTSQLKQYEKDTTLLHSMLSRDPDSPSSSPESAALVKQYLHRNVSDDDYMEGDGLVGPQPSMDLTDPEEPGKDDDDGNNDDRVSVTTDNCSNDQYQAAFTRAAQKVVAEHKAAAVSGDQLVEEASEGKDEGDGAIETMIDHLTESLTETMALRTNTMVETGDASPRDAPEVDEEFSSFNYWQRPLTLSTSVPDSLAVEECDDIATTKEKDCETFTSTASLNLVRSQSEHSLDTIGVAGVGGDEEKMGAFKLIKKQSSAAIRDFMAKRFSYGSIAISPVKVVVSSTEDEGGDDTLVEETAPPEVAQEDTSSSQAEPVSTQVDDETQDNAQKDDMNGVAVASIVERRDADDESRLTKLTLEALKSASIFERRGGEDENSLSLDAIKTAQQQYSMACVLQKTDLSEVLEGTLKSPSSAFATAVIKKADNNDDSNSSTPQDSWEDVAHNQDIIPQELLDHFLSMVDPDRATAVETDIARHCAYSLPAVALTIGRRNWPCLKQAYTQLATDMQWKVRRTLAFSIHDLASILGPDLTSTDLFPVFKAFLRDLDEVRIGILKHLDDFLRVLRSEERKSLLPHIADFLNPDNNRNWRFRHLLCEKLVPLCELYNVKDINEYFSPIALYLATETVAEIRKAAHILLATMLRCFHTAEKIYDDQITITNKFVQDIVRSFAKSEQYWRRRQTYCYICLEIIKIDAFPNQRFSTEMLPALLTLSKDRVPNVRIALAKLLSSIDTDYFEQSADQVSIEETIKKLSDDVAKDVRELALCL